MEESAARVIRVTLAGWFRVYGVKVLKVISDWLAPYRAELCVYDAYQRACEQYERVFKERETELTGPAGTGHVVADLSEWQNFKGQAESAQRVAERAMLLYEKMRIDEAIADAHRAGKLMACFQDFEVALAEAKEARERDNGGETK